jgi:anti-sigma-K factor RskA
MKKKQETGSPIKFTWKDSMKEAILYNKYIVSILEAEKDKRSVIEDWKRKEQFDKTLNTYKNKVKDLNKKRQQEISNILKSK